MNYEQVEKETIELAIKEEQEYYDYIILNAYKAKTLDLILEEISACKKSISEILENYCEASSF